MGFLPKKVSHPSVNFLNSVQSVLFIIPTRIMWKNYKIAMKEKRTGNGNNGKINDILKKEEIVVERLSAEVSGKAQKYSRMGPREFVHFEFEEVTVIASFLLK